MNYTILLVLCLYITSIYSAPTNVQLLPLQYPGFGMQPPNPFLPLQNPFFRQSLPNTAAPFMYPQQPIMLLLPNVATGEADTRFTKLNEDDKLNRLKTNTGHIDDKKDAVVIDADPNSAEIDPKRAVMIMPNGGRTSIGQIISYIPFLPIEINVPDTISWIASLIPDNLFGRPGQNPENTRTLNRGMVPILVIPAPMMQRM